MTGSHLLELYSHNSELVHPSDGNQDIPAKIGARMISNLIETIKVLRELRPRMFPSSFNEKDASFAKVLRMEFEEWVLEAEALVSEGTRLTQAGYLLPQLDELKDFIGLTHAMLQITWKDHVESIEQLRRGEGITYPSTGELRRDLQLSRNA